MEMEHNGFYFADRTGLDLIPAVTIAKDHNHVSLEEDVFELTIQDSPLNLWMGSLLSQESLDQPIELLGVNEGFTTNRPA
jgi:hypothetical protein